MPWGKGQSGNPGGRSKTQAMLARLCRSNTRDGLDLVEFAMKVLRGEVEVLVPTKLGVVDVGPSVRDRLTAMQWLSDRGWGKTPDAAEDEQGEPAIPSKLDEAQLEAGLGPEGMVQ